MAPFRTGRWPGRGSVKIHTLMRQVGTTLGIVLTLTGACAFFGPETYTDYDGQLQDWPRKHYLIDVTTDPPGAPVNFDGEFVGRSPLKHLVRRDRPGLAGGIRIEALPFEGARSAQSTLLYVATRSWKQPIKVYFDMRSAYAAPPPQTLGTYPPAVQPQTLGTYPPAVQRRPAIRTIADAVDACERVEKTPGTTVSCRVEYIDGVPSMVMGFRTQAEATSYLTPMAEQVAAPFCVAANSANRQAAVFIVVGGKSARRYSCELSRWDDWFELTPPKKSKPRPLTIAEAIAVCKEIQKDSSLPIGCATAYIRGTPSMVISFRNEKEADALLGAMANQVAGPFCEAANSSNRPAAVYMVIGGRHARPYSCEMADWGDWFELAPEDRQPSPGGQSL